MFRPLVLAGASTLALTFALTLHPAAAQQPTQAQRDAIRTACRSDFMANCASVTPGGKEALECLLRNQAKLSPACNSAVSAVVPAAAPAAPAAEKPAPAKPAAAEETPAKPAAEPAPKSEATQETQLKAVRQACTLNDFMAHCSWIKPDNPELVLCLQSNASDLSPTCQAAVQGLPPPAAQAPAPEKSEKKPAAAEPAKKAKTVREPEPAPAQPAASAAPAAPPTEAQKSAIRAACRSDFMANCSGVQPGGAEALQCLKSNAAKLSSGCRSAVAAIGGGAAPASASPAAPGASGPTPAVAPLGPIPPMLPREALRILATCRAEQQSLCGGIPVGGGRILTCLADHAQQLSLECYQALARATR
jgi:outer membrane biosynthesis protein TonB